MAAPDPEAGIDPWLDSVLRDIHREIVPLGVEDRLRAHRLWRARPDLRAGSAERRAAALAAVLGSDREQVTRIKRLTLRVAGTRDDVHVDARQATASGPTEASGEAPDASSARRRWLVGLLATAGALALALALTPPDTPDEAASDDPGVQISGVPHDAGAPAPGAVILDPTPPPDEQAAPTAPEIRALDGADAIAALLGGLLLVLGGWLVWRYSTRVDRQRAAHARRADAAAADRKALGDQQFDAPTSRAPAMWREAPPGAAESSWLLGQLARPRPSDDIDAEATADATAEAAGMLHIVPELIRLERPLVVLVDRGAEDHLWLGGFRRLVRFWQSKRVDLRAFEFGHRPEDLIDGAGRPHTLEQLARRWGDAPLLVLSHRLEPTARQGQASWLDVARAWPLRVWVDPEPRAPDRRGRLAVEARAVVESGFAHCPMTPDGLAAAARHLAGDPPGRAPRWPGLPEQLTAAQKRALTIWRAACALVPDPTWEVVEQLRAADAEVRRAFPDRMAVRLLVDELRRGLVDRHGAAPQLGESRKLVLPGQAVDAAYGALLDLPDGAELDRQIAGRQAQALAESPPTSPIEQLEARMKAAWYALRRSPSPETVARFAALRATAIGAQVDALLGLYAARSGSGCDEATRRALSHALAPADDGRLVAVDGLRPRRRWPLALAVVAAGAALLTLMGVWDGLRAGEMTVRLDGDDLWTLEVSPTRPLTEPARAVAAPTSILRLPDAEPPDGGPADAGVAGGPVDAAVPGPRADAGVEPARVLAATDNRPAMRPIRPGRFTMGSPPDEEGRFGSREDQHEVTVTRGFWLAETEVTEAQWTALMKSTPSRDGPSHPVANINWFEAVAYANALSEAEGLERCYQVEGCSGDLGAGQLYECDAVDFVGLACPGYRLPTEAEWEYAARAGTTGPRYGELKDIAVYDGSGGAKAPVKGNRQPNDWGLYDMIGNVYEWVQDAYESDITDRSEATLVEAPLPRSRVSRGCGWRSRARYCRAAFRGVVRPASRDGYRGLRPARTWPLDP